MEGIVDAQSWPRNLGQHHILDELKRTELPGKTKLDQFGGFEKFRWTLCQYAPIQFPPNTVELRDFFEIQNRIPMRLWLDGEELFRNVPEGVKILEKEEKNFGDISLRYVIFSPYKPIKPEEARGLQIRVRDVAIGFPRDFDVTKLGRVLGKLNMICGEVHIKEGLDNALMINRESFNYTSEVSDMYAFFQSKLRQWDSQLYALTEEDREIYEALGELKNNEKIVEGLKEIEVLHFSKERLRFPEAPITKTRKIKAETPFKKVISSLSKSKKADYEIISKRGQISPEIPPIEVQSSKKTITVYEDHPVFVETIRVGERELKVGYDEWDYIKTYFKICRLDDKENKAVFNTSHPIFKSKLDDEIIKKLSLGVLLILKDREDGVELVDKINQLIEQIFVKSEK